MLSPPPASLLSVAAPYLCAGLEGEGNNLHLGSTKIEGLTTADASELTIKAEPMRTDQSFAFTVGTGYRLDFSHRAALMRRVEFKPDT